MRISTVSITNLYGSYSNRISFNSDINLLVGINGSGKTSVLNCIDWIFRLDLASLATISFEEVLISF